MTMRTVLFFGLVSIAEAVGALSGWEYSAGGAFFGAMICIVVVVMDIAEAVKKLSGD